jgi:hypothetical protein
MQFFLQALCEHQKITKLHPAFGEKIREGVRQLVAVHAILDSLTFRACELILLIDLIQTNVHA